MLGIGISLTSVPVLGRREVSAAALMLANESQGLAIDFTDAYFLNFTGHYGSARVKDTGTPVNNYNSHPFGLLTYSGASPKLCRGPDGNLRYGAHNLLTYSEDFRNTTDAGENRPWAYVNVSVTTSAITAPDGSMASKLVENSVNNQHYLQREAIAPNGLQKAYTVWARAGERPGLMLFGLLGNIGLGFDLVNGTTFALSGVAVPPSFAIEHVGNGWYKCTITGLVGDHQFRLQMTATTDGTFAYQGDGSSGIYIWRAQIRYIPSDSTYLKTTSSPAYELPYEWDENGDLLGIRVEESRTNLCLWSSDLTRSTWTKSNITAAKTATGPDGVANSASTLTATAANATALQAITSTSAQRITSCYIKRRTGSGNIELTQDNGSTWTPVTVTSEWTRVNLPAVTSANPTVGIRIVTSGDAVDVALFQHEVGAFVTSPIETAGSTVTRAADNISLARTKFPWSDSEGTFIAEFSVRAVKIPGRVIGLLGADTPVAITSATNIISYSDTELVQKGVAVGVPNVTGRVVKAASAYTASGRSILVDGGSEVSGGSIGYRTPTRMFLGSEEGSANFSDIYLRRLVYVPRRMTTQEQQALTAP